jgi:hypothetical protein
MSTISDQVIYTDGGEAIGWIRRYDTVFVVFDAHGKLRGRFATEQQPMRAFSRRRCGIDYATLDAMRGRMEGA